MDCLINTIIEDAKPGMYVCKRNENSLGLPAHFAPREYQKATKVVYYCFDDGSILRYGIGDVDFYNCTGFSKGNSVLPLIVHPSGFDNVSALNSWIGNFYLGDFIESWDDDGFDFKKEECAPAFLDLVKYLYEWYADDQRTEPEPFKHYGFIYKKEECDGEKWFRILAVTNKEGHRKIEEKEDE